MRKVQVDLEDLLDLVNAAEDFGYADDVFMSTMADWAGKVTMAEINEYGDLLAQQPGFSEDDGENAVETLKAWRKQYCGVGR